MHERDLLLGAIGRIHDCEGEGQVLLLLQRLSDFDSQENQPQGEAMS